MNSEVGEVIAAMARENTRLIVRALQAAGYAIYAINPLAASRYRDRHAVSKKKWDRAAAMMLADLVRTDRHNHR